MRTGFAIRAFLGAAWFGIAGCQDTVDPPTQDDNTPGMAIVSDPVSSTPPPGALARSAALTVSVAYVSLLPGSFPRGVSTMLTNRRTAASLSIALVDGGLDPVPIAAETGDTLAFAVDTGGSAPVRFAQTVPQFTRVRIVRTDPAGGKRDVPLNLRIRIIFSEPVLAASVNEGTVGLEQAGAPVDGQVILSADGLEAGFEPAEGLLPETDYSIVIRQGVRDADGSELGAFSAGFTTGPSGTPFGAIEIVLSPTGSDVDGEYVATLDGDRPLSIYPTLSQRPVYFSAVSTGTHVLALTAPVNCSVERGELPITVRAGFISRAEFSVRCEPFLGLVRITAPTSGSTPGSSRFRVTHSSAGYWDYGTGPFADLGTLDPNDTLVVPIQMSKTGSSYWHFFMLEDVPPSCIVVGFNPTEGDSLTFRDTLEVEFPVTCGSGSPPPAGLDALAITASTTGTIPAATRYSLMHAIEGPWDYGPGEFTLAGSVAPNGRLVLPLDRSTSTATSFRHYFLLANVPARCTVLGTNPIDAGFLEFSDTLFIRFRVACATEVVR
jgi:Big-like domain-containing protein